MRPAFIAAGLVLAVSAFFVATVPLKPEMWPASVFAIIIFSLPVVIGAVRWLGLRPGLLLVALLGVYALGFETMAVASGLPYGEFAYGGLLGPTIAGLVPVTVLVAWTPLVLGVYSVLYTRKGQGSAYAIASATILLVLTDMVLDPAAVYLGFWAWVEPGSYYGVPWVNFLGWVISGGIAAALLVWYVRRFAAGKVPSPLLAYNFLAILGFWTLVNAFAGQWIPALLGVALTGYVAQKIRNLHHTKAVTLEQI